MSGPKYKSVQPDHCNCYTAWVRYESKLPLRHILDSAICFIDTETTGLGYGDRIIEIAMCRVENGVTDWLVSMVDPIWVPISPKAREICGITEADLEGAPMLYSIAPRIAELASGAYMIAHNASFDRRMLDQSWGDLGDEAPSLNPLGWVCSQQLAREHITGLKSYSLQSLVTSLSLPQHTAHRAEGDVHTLMALWAYITRGY